MRRVILPALAALLFGCPSKDGSTCSTSDDCAQAGQELTRCVNGACVRACERDEDCASVGDTCPENDPTCSMSGNGPKLICQALLCVAACPDTPCQNGETCNQGRCSSFFESFEKRPTDTLGTLEEIGWNNIPHPLHNAYAKRVTNIELACKTGDDPDKCAGNAAHGIAFLAAERAPTPAMRQPRNDLTCGSCRCCLECRDGGSRGSFNDREFACPTLTLPAGAMCTADVPAACQSVCAACDACPTASDRTIGMVSQCESQAATHGCPSCQTYQQCCMTNGCALQAGQSMLPANHPCKMASDQCSGCGEYKNRKQRFPNDPSMWADVKAICMGQGGDGCYETPSDYLRGELTDDEQAITSPAIDLSAAPGEVLEFEYVSFNIAPTYRRTREGLPPTQWPVEPQEVVVQLCAGGCDQSDKWVEAKFADGNRAAMPAADERDNGLAIGSQTIKDWQLGRRTIAIPAEFRTKDFHFRFLPRLADHARIGIDRVLIRRQ